MRTSKPKLSHLENAGVPSASPILQVELWEPGPSPLLLLPLYAHSPAPHAYSGCGNSGIQSGSGNSAKDRTASEFRDGGTFIAHPLRSLSGAGCYSLRTPVPSNLVRPPNSPGEPSLRLRSPASILHPAPRGPSAVATFPARFPCGRVPLECQFREIEAKFSSICRQKPLRPGQGSAVAPILPKYCLSPSTYPALTACSLEALPVVGSHRSSTHP